MDIKIKCDRDFELALDNLRHKYGEDFEFLNGLHESQIDTTKFINAFIDKHNVADATIDSNANVINKDIRSLLNEKGKSEEKLLCYAKIFYEMKKKYSLAVARLWLEAEWSGLFYMHDSSSSTFLPYCYAYSLDRLAKEGLFFLGNYNHEPAKHLTTFLDHVIEYVSFFSNRSSGATGIPNVLLWTYYFWKRDVENGFYMKDPIYYLKQCFQKLIYRLNQPFLRITQPSFVNVSIFDKPYLESLFGGIEYPDGSFVIDNIDELIKHEKIFMEVVSSIRNVNLFTYPVLTYSVLKRSDISREEKLEMIRTHKYNVFVDKEFARWCSDHNVKWNDSNFFISSDVGTLSNCFSKDQFALIKTNGEIKCQEFGNIYYQLDSPNVEILNNGEWKKAKFLHLNPTPLYTIKTNNGKELIATDNHIHVTDNGDKTTLELFNDMYTNDVKIISKLKNNLSIHEGINSDSPSEIAGYIIGAYLLTGKSEYNSYIGKNEFSFNVSSDKLNEVKEFITSNNQTFSIRSSDEFNMIVSAAPEFEKLINNYTSFASMSIGKELQMKCIDDSIEFRNAILDGLTKDDKITINAKRLCNELCALITSLGKVSKIVTSDCNDPDCDENNLTYTIEILENEEWDEITSIELLELRQPEKLVYCVEVLDDPYFVLPNGIQTHNCCRLLSDTKKLDAFINSIGGTALSIGSVKVNTINLMRIALESPKNNNSSDIKEKYSIFLNNLRNKTTLCCQVLDVVRHIIQRNVEKGLLPNYCEGGIEIDKQYCTIGILGSYEVMNHYGLINFDEFGNASYTDEAIDLATEMFKVLNDVKDNFTKDYSFNIESVPAERAAVILCQKDNKLYPESATTFIYSNQWIPLMQKCTINEKLRVSSILDAKCSGGAIAHINLENNFPDNDAAWEMLNKIALSDVIYFAFNTRLNECKNFHGFVGTDHCPICGEEVYDTYQRIVGYLTPSRSYSSDRLKEFNTRRWYEYASELKEF